MNKEKMATVGDQGLKGALIGLYSYATTKFGLDVEAVAALTPLVLILINWLSTQVGNPDVASFFAKKLDK